MRTKRKHSKRKKTARFVFNSTHRFRLRWNEPASERIMRVARLLRAINTMERRSEKDNRQTKKKHRKRNNNNARAWNKQGINNMRINDKLRTYRTNKNSFLVSFRCFVEAGKIAVMRMASSFSICSGQARQPPHCCCIEKKTIIYGVETIFLWVNELFFEFVTVSACQNCQLHLENLYPVPDWWVNYFKKKTTSKRKHTNKNTSISRQMQLAHNAIIIDTHRYTLMFVVGFFRFAIVQTQWI